MLAAALARLIDGRLVHASPKVLQSLDHATRVRRTRPKVQIGATRTVDGAHEGVDRVGEALEEQLTM